MVMYALFANCRWYIANLEKHLFVDAGGGWESKGSAELSGRHPSVGCVGLFEQQHIVGCMDPDNPVG